MSVINLFSGYIYGLARSTSKKLSESVVETAQTLKRSVDEGKINGIIDKVMIITTIKYSCSHMIIVVLSLLFMMHVSPSDHTG